MATMTITAALILPLLGAVFAPLLTRLFGERAAWPLSLSLFVPFLVFVQHAPLVAFGKMFGRGRGDERALTESFSWAPSMGADFSFRLDGLSFTFALLISGIGTLIVLYAGAYLKGHPRLGQFFTFILLFSTSMLGVVLADNLLLFFIFWELTSITSFLLIGFNHEQEASRRAAFQALVVTGGGGLFLLGGLLLIMAGTGETSFTGLRLHWQSVQQMPGIEIALGLVLVGAFAKSAQFPFHFWLPEAMQAPTPVSAFLHSATMVKAGVYLLMRLSPTFRELDLWQVALPLFGATTLLAGAWLSLRQTDLKLMLAYTTVSSLGLLVMLTGLDFDRAAEAAVLYLIAHALFKGTLFMVAGVIDHEAGTRDLDHLGGLRRSMPLTSAAAVLAAFSMAGIPLFAGFMAKEEIYAALLDMQGGYLLLAAAVIGNAMMAAAAFAIAFKPFMGTEVKTPKHAHDGPVKLMAGPLLLACAGLLAPFVTTFLAEPMASAIRDVPLTIEASVLPHVSWAFALSALTLVFAALLFFVKPPAISLFTFNALFDAFVASLVRAGFSLQKRLQSGRLEIYLTLTFAVIGLALWLPMIVGRELPKWPSWSFGLQFHEAAFMLIAVLGLFAVLGARTRLTAIVSLGIQGFAIAVLYLLFGAPDLSFTQFMIETLSVVILALIMTRLKLDVADRRPLGQILLDGTIALVCGSGFALYLLRAVEVPFDATLSTFFGHYSKLVAHGANVVNVIIVDFRGSDTLGEIAVVVITGLAVLALIRLRAPDKPPADNEESDA